MKKLYYLTTMLTGLLLVSCSKSDLQSSPEDSSLPFKKKHGGGATIKSAGDGQNDLLGYGYDVTGEFANSSASKFAVIDVSRLKADHPTRVEWDLSSKKYGEVIAGENAISYLSALTDKLGAGLSIKDPTAPANTDPKSSVIPLFKANIDNAFDNTNSRSSKYVYSGYALKIQQKRVKLNADKTLLWQYLTPSFIADVQNGTPQSIVSAYGTHILKDIVLGAKLDITYRAETTKSDRKDAATKGMDINVLGIFSINTKNTTMTHETIDNTNQRLSFKAIGGEPSASLFGNIAIGSTLPVISTAQWENSSSLQNAEMIDIAQDGLIPIWDLISDPIKSGLVKAYVIQYLLSNKISLVPEPVYSFYHPVAKDHAYTINKNDYPYLQNGWQDGGISFYAYSSQVPGTLPIYSFYHPVAKGHAYTINRYDYPYLQNGWQENGIVFYAYASQARDLQPVYYFYHPVAKDHAYTINKNDYPYFQNGWIYGEAAFYVPRL